jgi:hypothetical protein
MVNILCVQTFCCSRLFNLNTFCSVKFLHIASNNPHLPSKVILKVTLTHVILYFNV